MSLFRSDRRVKYSKEDMVMIMSPKRPRKWDELAEYFGTSKHTLQQLHVHEKRRLAKGYVVCRTSDVK